MEPAPQCKGHWDTVWRWGRARDLGTHGIDQLCQDLAKLWPGCGPAMTLATARLRTELATICLDPGHN